MSDEIRPALTAEEWARHGFEHGPITAERFRDLFVGRPTKNVGVRIDHLNAKHLTWVSDTPADCHALAALCLHGQSFGFTHKELAALRKLDDTDRAYVFLDRDDGSDESGEPFIASALAKIAALLPPPPS
jgi:hypothetical protein